MTPEEFRAKWQGVTASERQAAQSHFEDLCRLLGVQTPLEADPSGTWYENILTLNGRWPRLLFSLIDSTARVESGGFASQSVASKDKQNLGESR
jgi:hypothetical protein